MHKEHKSVKRTFGRGLTKQLRALEINDSITCDKALQKRVHTLAKQIGIKVMTGAEDGNQIRIERVE